MNIKKYVHLGLDSGKPRDQGTQVGESTIREDAGSVEGGRLVQEMVAWWAETMDLAPVCREQDRVRAQPFELFTRTTYLFCVRFPISSGSPCVQRC